MERTDCEGKEGESPFSRCAPAPGANSDLERSRLTHRHVVRRGLDALGLPTRSRRVSKVRNRVLRVRHLVRLHLLLRDQVVKGLEARGGGTGFVGTDGENDSRGLVGGGPAELEGGGERAFEGVWVYEELPRGPRVRRACQKKQRRTHEFRRRVLQLVRKFSRLVRGVRSRKDDAGALRRQDDHVVVDAVGREEADDVAWRKSCGVAKAVGESLGVRAQFRAAGCVQSVKTQRSRANGFPPSDSVRGCPPLPLSATTRDPSCSPQLPPGRAINDGRLVVPCAPRVGPDCTASEAAVSVEKPERRSSESGERDEPLSHTEHSGRSTGV